MSLFFEIEKSELKWYNWKYSGEIYTSGADIVDENRAGGYVNKLIFNNDYELNINCNDIVVFVALTMLVKVEH